MATDFRTALGNRRTYYDISAKNTVSDSDIKEIVDYAVLNTPSAFNSQSARVILLFGDSHKKHWETVRDTLRKIVPAEKFAPTDAKIDSFAAGYGTILFYEDQDVIEKLQRDFPSYRDAFPGFSLNSAGMLQLAVWTMLCDVGLGASLQHYSNLIEGQVASMLGLDPKWRLIAEMPYGIPNSKPGPKEQTPLDIRIKVFG